MIEALIQKSIDYMERHWNSGISLEDCAAAAGYSACHFCRLFHTVTGMTVKEYLRKRRVTRAAVLINETSLPLKDIAVRCGFQSQENFVRVFKKTFGILPTEYRKSRYSLPLLDKITVTGKNREDFSDIPAPSIEYVKDFWVAGLRHRTSFENNRHYQEVPLFWNRFYGSRLYEGIPTGNSPRTDYGVSILKGLEDIYNEKNGRRALEFFYLTGTRVEQGATVPEGFELLHIPAQSYAVFQSPPSTHYTLIDNLRRTWDYIDFLWLPSSPYVHAGGMEFNEYRPEENQLEKKIYIPILPKQDGNRTERL